MTNRLKYPTPWASGGTAKDPDLDTTHPSYIADRYATVGWKSEKLPEEWQNFLSQISDDKIIERIVKGIVEFDSTVTYTEGAVYAKSGKWYKIEGGVEKEILSINLAEYSSLISTLNGLITSHLSADNPHNDTIGGLVGGGYEKPAVDDAFGSPTDPKTIVYHKARVDIAAHGETPEQIGTLPVTGGKFTGQIGFLSKLLNGSGYLQFNRGTGRTELTVGTTTLSVDATGNSFYLRASHPDSLIMTEANYPDMQIRAGFVFALPVPMASMHLVDDINDLEGIGKWTVETTSAPVFVAGRGLTITGNNTKVYDLINTTLPSTVVAITYAGTAKTVTVSDYGTGIAWANTSLADICTALGLTGVTEFHSIVIYPMLSAYQKSMLVK